MKKTVFFLLAVMLTATSLVYGSGQQGQGSGGKSVPGYTGSLPYAEFDWYTANTPLPDVAMVNDAINAYVGPKLNMKVNMYFWPSTDWQNKMTVMVSSGEDAGIIGFGNATRMDYGISAARGSYYAIEKLLDQYAPKTKALFNDGVWRAMTVNDHIYGIPALRDCK